MQKGNGEENVTTANNDEGNGEKGAEGEQDNEMAPEQDGDDNVTTATNNEGRGKKGADSDQDGDMAGHQGALRFLPGRDQARRQELRGWGREAAGHQGATELYEAKTKTRVKKPGRGGGAKRDDENTWV